MAAHLVVNVVFEAASPPVGIVVRGSTTVRFSGWLALLRALADEIGDGSELSWEGA